MPSPSVSIAVMVNSFETRLYCPSKPDGRLVATTSETLPKVLNKISSNVDVAQIVFVSNVLSSDLFIPETG